MPLEKGAKHPTPEQLFPLPIDAERARAREVAKAAAPVSDRDAMLARIAARNERLKASKNP